MEGGDIDFHPLSPEGQGDINEQIEDEYDSLITPENEFGESWFSKMKTKFGDNAEYAVGYIRDRFEIKNPKQDIPEYMELHNFDVLEQNQDDAVEEIKKLYLNPDTSKFISRIDEWGRVKVKLTGRRSKDYEINDPNLPKTIKNALGSRVEEVINNLENANERDQNIINEQNLPVNERVEAQERIDNRNNEIEHLNERLSLRERIKEYY